MPTPFWTNPSVVAFAERADPVEAILERAQTVVLEALEAGWPGPPFDPFALAKIRGLKVVPSEDVGEACLVSGRGDQLEIRYNPQKPKTRVRYSIAHEIAHTIFDDCGEKVRFRNALQKDRADEWQLEMLCNLAAAEFLMPIGSFPEFDPNALGIDQIMEWRKRYEVSTEAMLLRTVRLGPPSMMAFAASTNDGEHYVLDYALRAEGSVPSLYGKSLSRTSPVSRCTAIGFTAKGEDVWEGVGAVRLECAGLASYPGSLRPRVVGIARPLEDSGEREWPGIEEVVGDATEPHGKDARLLVHVVNDKALSWGAGFGKTVAQKFPQVAKRFREHVTGEGRLKLGEIFATPLDEKLTVVQMIAQQGFGSSEAPRLRYLALQTCLRQVAHLAREHGASVHMPRIGTGYGGGSWMLIRELIEQELVRHGVQVTIYQWLKAGDKPASPRQQSLF